MTVWFHSGFRLRPACLDLLLFSALGGDTHIITRHGGLAKVLSQQVACGGEGGSGCDAHCLKGNKGLRAWTAGLQCRDRLQKSPNSCF